MKLEYKKYDFKLENFDEQTGVFSGFASVYGNQDEHEEYVDAGAFSKAGNVPILWGHMIHEVIGGTKQVTDVGTRLEVIGELETDVVQRGKEAYALIKKGFVTGLSVGFITTKEAYEDGKRHIQEADLKEISITAFPANPFAQIQNIKELERKGAIPYRKTPLAPRSAEWDGPAEMAAADVEDLRIMCAWVDSDNPDIKQSYKLPHHKAAGEHACVFRGVTAALGRLNQTQGLGSDAGAVEAHLKKHQAEFQAQEAEDENTQLQLKEIKETLKTMIERLETL